MGWRQGTSGPRLPQSTMTSPTAEVHGAFVEASTAMPKSNIF